MVFSNKSVLITGAGGFIGLNTVKEFHRAGFNVHALVHKNIPEELRQLDEINIIQADITDKNSVLKELNGFQPDIIVHIAGLASDVGTDDEFRKLNYEPIKYLAELPKEKIIYISSTDVYGIKDFCGEDEDRLEFEKYPKNPYPKYKIKSEKWLRKNIDSSKYVIIRPAAVYGENDKTLENRVVEFLETSPFIVHFGRWKGKNQWPMADVKNVAAAICMCAQTDEFNGEAINIVDEQKVTIDEYYHRIANKYFPDKKFKTICLPMWIGKLLGYVSTSLTKIFKLKQPLFEPTSYSVLHVSSNLFFSCRKFKKLISKKHIDNL